MARIDLASIASGNNVFANANAGTIVVQAADPQGGYGCNADCSLPVTPSATRIAPSLNAVTCKFITTLEREGTGTTGATLIVGLSQWGAEQAILYGEEIECGDELDFTEFPIVTAEAGLGATGDWSGENHLAKYNQISSFMPTIHGNIQIRVTGTAEADVNAQLAESLHVIAMDVNNNLSVCMVELNANDCSICVNPNSSTNNIATFSPNCPLYVDATHGYAYRILSTTETVKLTACILATEVVNDYTPCGA